MITGRTAFYRGFLVIIHPYPKRGMTAYRNPEYFNAGMASYEVGPGVDISDVIISLGDHGDFSQEEFDELSEGTSRVPIVDTCVGCGVEFPADELMYEGIEPIVFDPRCHICIIKQAQDRFGPENVILPDSWRQ